MTRRMLVLSSVIALLSSCLSDEPSQLSGTVLGCQTDSDCVSGMQCTTEGFCKDGRAVCGDGVVDSAFGETCDDGNDNLNDSCPSGPNGTCQTATCGDGFVWDTDGGDEACESGVSEDLKCQDVDTSDFDGLAGCSADFCLYNVSVCFEIPPGFVRIEAGTFTMGSPESELGRYSDEENHQVTLTHGFYMSDHEVTQAEWKALIGNNPSGLNRDACDTCPVDSVNWWEALYYANSLSNLEELTPCYVLEGCSGAAGEDLICIGVSLQDGSGSAVTTPYECEGYRLPTEAEWEYAARAGTASAFYNGPITSAVGLDPNAEAIAWYKRNSGSTTHAVKGKLPNAWGLYDMSGNVWEWTWDWYGSYPGDVTDPTGPGTGSKRVERGGSWFNEAMDMRSAGRSSFTPDLRDYELGFRVARTVR